MALSPVIRKRFGPPATGGSLVILLAVVWSVVSCNDRDPVARTTDAGQSIVIFNHTGHLIQQSSDACGDGITARFVLSTSSDHKEYVFGPDSFRSVFIGIEKGAVLNIKVYEVISGGDVLLVERDVNYSPDGQDASQDRPTVILCPKTDLELLGF